MLIVIFLYVDLSRMNARSCNRNKTKAGAEPKLVTLVDSQDEPVSLFIVADGIQLCEVPSANVASALLALLATYFMLTLDFPDQYA